MEREINESDHRLLNSAIGVNVKKSPKKMQIGHSKKAASNVST